MRKILVFVLFVFLTAFAISANAIPITFTYDGSGSGILGEISFLNADFTITAWGDTDNRSDYSSGYFIDHDSASIFINGLGTFDFITGTRTFDHTVNGVVGFSRAGILGADLFNSQQHSVFTSWDMLSSIGPISGMGSLIQWTSSDVITNSGVLAFNSETVPMTFQATVGSQAVPEPSTMLLLGAGLAGLGILRKRNTA